MKCRNEFFDFVTKHKPNFTDIYVAEKRSIKSRNYWSLIHKSRKKTKCELILHISGI